MPASLASPRPRTEAQRAAARANGARSRGPVTPEGKARASLNALRHGLCSARTVLAPGEDPAAFEALLAELRAEHRPDDATRHLLVERLAVTLWKLARCDRLEAELAACRPRPPAGRVYPDGTPALLSRTAELASLSAHAARLERALHRILRALAERPGRARTELPEHAEETDRGGSRRSEIRANEPERPAGAAETAAAWRGDWPEAALSAAPGEPRERPPEPAGSAEAPDPEAALLARARSEPALALSLAERLAEEGELARLHHLARELGPGLAGALGRPLSPAAGRGTSSPGRAW